MTTKQKIERWKELKDIESEAKEERIKIENSLIEKFPDKMSGKEKVENLEISFKATRSIDQEMAESLVKEYDKTPFKIKYDLDKKLYDSIKELSPDMYKNFSRAVTEKPGRPTFTITGEKK